MAAENRDVERLYDKFESVCDKLDTVLQMLGRVEPWLEDAPKAREKVQELEVAVATHKTQISDVREKMTEESRQQFFKSLLSSSSFAALSFVLSYFVPHK